MIEAMKQALEALDLVYEQVDFSNGVTDPTGTIDEGKVVIGGIVGAAIAALHQAIAEAEKQEPVAWTVRDYVDGFRYVSSTENPSGTIAGLSEPLYTAPPKREWVGLTDEEIDYIWGISPGDYEDKFAFPRAIEAKLRERNT